MFVKDPSQVYRARLLAAFKWLDHGFGTKNSTDWPGTRRLTTVKQVHSNTVLIGDRPGSIGEGDALISSRPGATLAVRTADCVPMLYADPVRRAVAAVHAGWRGTAAGVSVAAVEAMSNEFGSRPQDLLVAIGPGIGVCCYEVGPEVATQFGRSGRVKLDLALENTRQLVSAGVLEHNIVSAGLCTACLDTEFYSYRRDRTAGRMVSAIGIRG